MDFFWLKKLAGAILNPLALPLLILIGAVGLIFLRRRSGRWLAAAALALLYLASLGPVADLLTRPLESGYSVVDPARLPPDLGAVVVLSGGATEVPGRPPGFKLSPSTLTRLIEGLRLWRARPGARLILSSGNWRAVDEPDAKAMADLARRLGVPAQRIALEAVSRDTAENAVQTSKMVGNSPFVVVTSGVHLRRTELLYRNLGFKPIMAPADLAHPESWELFSVLPQVGALAATSSAVHEYLGLAWYWMTGSI